jgi:hypothetical protein
LITLLPQHFDAEITDTIKNYRYRKASHDADLDLAPEYINTNPEPLLEPEIGFAEPEAVEPLVTG